jgi:hypothetical protein
MPSIQFEWGISSGLRYACVDGEFRQVNSVIPIPLVSTYNSTEDLAHIPVGTFCLSIRLWVE